MNLQTTKQLNIDFSAQKYILVDVKQYDRNSRFILVTCYNQGSIFNLNAKNHSVYVRYKKADGSPVLNFCKINNRGEVLVELTEQMIAAGGICYVDLVVINKGQAIINIDTGEIITVDDSSILSTMAFCVNVYEVSVDNSEIESSTEFECLNDLFKKAEADYKEVVQLAKSYAVGDAGGIRDNEDIDNSKYYYEQTSTNVEIAKTSEINSLASETNAKISEENSKISETNASASETNANTGFNKNFIDYT